MYVLICQPVPSGLLSRVIIGTKVHPVYLSKQSRGHVCRFCMTRLLTHFFYTPTWVFPGDPSFLLAVDDIITTCHVLPAEAPPISDESSNQKLSHLNTPSHMHSNIRRDVMRFILHPTFREETSTIHNTPSIPGTSSTLSCHSSSFAAHTSYLMFFSYVQGKCGIIWHAMPTLLMSQHYPCHITHLFGACTHDLYLTFLL